MGLLDDAIREHLDLKRRRGADPAEIERAEREALGPVRREPSVSAAVASDMAPGIALKEVAGAQDDEVEFVAEPEDLDAAGEPTTRVGTPAEDPAAPGIAAPGYEDPEFDEFAATEPPASSGPELEPAAPVFEREADQDFDLKPKRRGLFHRRSHEPVEERPALPEERPEDDPFAETPDDDAAFDDAAAEAEDLAGEAAGPAQPVQREAPRAEPPSLRIAPETKFGHTAEYDIEQIFVEEDKDDDGTPAEGAKAGEDILEETPEFLADTPDHDRLWFEQKPPPDFDFDN